MLLAMPLSWIGFPGNACADKLFILNAMQVALEKMFLEQQISILEWFLKDHVTLKPGVKIQIWITGINYIWKYIQIETQLFQILIIFQTTTIYCCIIDQINTGLLSIRDFFQKSYQS